MSSSTVDVARRPVVSPRSVLVPGGWVIAGIVLLTTAAVRWIRTGPGSRFGGLELADNLRTGVLSPDWGIWVAVTVYSIVGVGGALIATAMIERRVVVMARAALSVLGTASFGLLAWGVLPLDKWSAGPTMASIAFAFSTALSVYQLFSAPLTSPDGT